MVKSKSSPYSGTLQNVRPRGLGWETSVHWSVQFEEPLLLKSDVNTLEPTLHYNDVIISMMASQIISLTVVYSIVYSGADQRKHQSSASLAFVWGIHRWPVNSPHKEPVTRKMFPFDDVIMNHYNSHVHSTSSDVFSAKHSHPWARSLNPPTPGKPLE